MFKRLNQEVGSASLPLASSIRQLRIAPGGDSLSLAPRGRDDKDIQTRAYCASIIGRRSRADPLQWEARPESNWEAANELFPLWFAAMGHEAIDLMPLSPQKRGCSYDPSETALGFGLERLAWFCLERTMRNRPLGRGSLAALAQGHLN